MTNDRSDKVHGARRAIEAVLTAANGGTMPSITVHLTDDDTPAPPFDANASTDTLFAAWSGSGHLDVAIGIRTHWTMLWHFDFRMARTPGGQFVLLGSQHGKPVHATIEDDRFSFEEGSPLLDAADTRTALACFDAEFAALMAEML